MNQLIEKIPAFKFEKLHFAAASRAVASTALVLLSAGSTLGEAKTYKSKASQTALEIHSNVTSAKIIRDGIAAGDAGTSIEIEPGKSYITISANGYVSKEIYLNAIKNKKTVITVNLVRDKRRTSKQKEWKKLKKSGFVDISSNESVCMTLADLAKDNSVTRDVCNRKTLREDILYADMSWKKINSPPQFSYKQRHEDIFNSLDSASTQKWYFAAEKLYGENRTSAETFALLTWGNLLGGNCHRSLQMIHSANSQGISTPHLFTVRGLCFESNGKRDAAIKLMKIAAKKSPKTPEAFFHLARLLLPTKPALTKKALIKCHKLFETYSPCYEFLVDLYIANNELKKSDRLVKKYIKTAQSNLGAVTKSIFTKLTTKKIGAAHKEAEKMVEILNDSYSVNWLRVITAPKAKRKKFTAKALTWKIYDEDVAESVLNKVADFKGGNMMLPAYQTFITKYPKKTYYKWKLALYHNKNGQCPEAVAIVDGLLLDENTKQRAGLLDIKGHCQLRGKDYEGATSTFEQFIGLKPEDWLGYFNLGNVYERQGFREKAVEYFQSAVSKSPPSQYLSRLKGKIKRNSKKK